MNKCEWDPAKSGAASLGGGCQNEATVKLGRRFVGIEQNERWFDLSCRRIAAALKEPDLFVAAPKAVQLSILDGAA